MSKFTHERRLGELPGAAWTIKELADACGFSRNYLTRWFRKNPYGILVAHKPAKLHKQTYTSVRIMPEGVSAFLRAHRADAQKWSIRK